jgi:hypothetical protein
MPFDHVGAGIFFRGDTMTELLGASSDFPETSKNFRLNRRKIFSEKITLKTVVLIGDFNYLEVPLAIGIFFN